jgi:alpha-glucosidase
MTLRRLSPATPRVLLIALTGWLMVDPAEGRAADYTVKSPDGKVSLTVAHDVRAGTLSYRIRNRATVLLEKGSLGITTSLEDFTSGLALADKTATVVKESYRLPTGKRSAYDNHANELTLSFTKGGREVRLVLRAYDDGIAFRYAVPGTGPLEILGETTTFPLAGNETTYWGQAHPNNYGYETALGPVTGDRISMPVLAELKDRQHFVLVAQAASYKDYIIPNYRRQGSVLTLSFPMDQKEPVKAARPFQTPWRVVIISPRTPGKIVESTLIENLNPPTEANLQNAAWIRPGRASWDFIAGDGADLRRWIDFDAQMGWEWHVADAGWESRVPAMAEVAAYGKSKGVGIMVWGKVANKTFLNTPERAEAWMSELEKLGIGGAKVDFFDQRDTTVEKTDDLEDTQARLIVRDFLSEIGARHKLVVEFHGCAIPSGERRRWPHLMSAEAVYGLERRTQNLQHDLTIPYVRNVMGPVSFTPFHLTRSAGSLAYQLGQAVLYEAGIQIFAERHDRILAFEGVDFLKAVPSTWDDIRFLDGHPGRHAILARRKGADWFVGGITDAPRTATVTLGFLRAGVSYEAEVYRDGDTKTALVREKKTVTSRDVLSIPMLQAGGFAVRLAAAAASR